MKSESAATRPRPETGVIQGKLAIPLLPEQRVVRARVEQLLVELVKRHRVVVVSATAGAGKTTAVAGAVRRLDRPVAWLTVDRTDAAPGRLVTYLEAALALRLPQVRGAATGALAAGIPHAEAAGLLAEAIGAAQVVLVLDELERLPADGEPWAVIEALLRYAPQGVRTVLISRRAIPALGLPLASGTSAALGEAELAFTPAEAAEALASHGSHEIDAAAAVQATGGWVTGVLFEAWSSADHVAGMGGEADPLHGYLSAHIVGQLDPRDREFLVATSLLDAVTVERAEALGQAEAGERLRSLHAARVPVSWEAAGGMRCHSRFREYLLERLQRRGEQELRALRIAHGRLLADEGHDEEATEELLRAAAPEQALVPAARAIIPVIERLDFGVAERWLDALAAVAPSGASAFTVAELMLALGQADFRRGVRIADQLAALGEREPLARSSAHAAALMAWSYCLFGRLDDAHAVLDAADDGRPVEVLRYALPHVEPGPPPPDRPSLTGDPFDALVLASDLLYGRLSLLPDESHSRWIDAISGARRIAKLRATGRTQRALELYELAREQGQATVQLEAWTGPEVLIDAGRNEEAREAIGRGRSLAKATGSPVYELQTYLPEAKLALRLERDPAAARAVLDRVERRRGDHPFPVIFEPLDTWYGLALLLESEDAAALDRLRRAVPSMVTGDRMLELPTAAVYLSEAEWRAGHEEAADRAADLALDAAHRLGSNHVLLQALADMPAVVSRRIDAEPGADSPWHALGRALIAQGVAVDAQISASVQLQEFGRCTILVNGDEVRPRIAKTYELLAYLATASGARAEREELLEALFDGRSDDSTQAYLRQAIQWLRRVLPGPEAVAVEHGRVRLTDAVGVTTESARFRSMLAEAARLQGEERLTGTIDALTIHDRGEYLPGARSSWADHRRQELAALATDARHEAAELALAADRLDDAERLAADVLRADPFREAAWRVTMRVADALGDGDRVIRAYQGCERALARLGTTPAPSTRQLLERLRR